MNLVLVGFRCVGKTTVGRELARELGLGFLDMDELIESELGTSIWDFVCQNGWHAFREVESMVLRSLIKLDGYVISTGGGVVTRPTNLKVLKSLGMIIWLKASEETIIDRLKQSPRPALTEKGPMEEVGPLLHKRSPMYLAIADFVFDTDTINPMELARLIALTIETAWKEKEVARK